MYPYTNDRTDQKDNNNAKCQQRANVNESISPDRLKKMTAKYLFSSRDKDTRGKKRDRFGIEYILVQPVHFPVPICSFDCSMDN